MRPAARATAASRAIALRRYCPTHPPASAVPLVAVGTATWACGLTADRSRTCVPSDSDPGPPEIPSRTRDLDGVTSLQGPAPGHVCRSVINLSGKALQVPANIGTTQAELRSLGHVRYHEAARKLVSWYEYLISRVTAAAGRRRSDYARSCDAGHARRACGHPRRCWAVSCEGLAGKRVSSAPRDRS